jgi:hypothetical protein
MALPMEETGSLRIIRFALTIAIAVILASAVGEMMELSPVLTALLAGGICVGANIIFISAFGRWQRKG